MLRRLLTACLSFVLAGFVFSSETSETRVERVHFLIPAGAGGGWDGTARAVGRVLKETAIVDRVSFENLSGGGGGRAIAHFVETAARQSDTLLVSSTPIVIRALQGLIPTRFAI